MTAWLAFSYCSFAWTWKKRSDNIQPHVCWLWLVAKKKENSFNSKIYGGRIYCNFERPGVAGAVAVASIVTPAVRPSAHLSFCMLSYVLSIKSYLYANPFELFLEIQVLLGQRRSSNKSDDDDDDSLLSALACLCGRWPVRMVIAVQSIDRSMVGLVTGLWS